MNVSDFFAHQSQHDWLLILKAHDTWALDQLVDSLGKFDASMNLAVQADSQKVGLYLRKKAPRWIFAADSASLLRLKLFESLWVETVLDFWPDFVVLPGPVDKRGLAEMRRRAKRVLLDWNEGSSDSDLRELDFAQGVITANPVQAVDKLGHRFGLDF